jgi:ankyrin
MGHQKVIRVLLEKGANANALNRSKKQTALHIASHHGHADCVRTLLTLGKADVNAQDDQGFTPLYLASRKGYKAVVIILLEFKAQMHKETGKNTPLGIAKARGHLEIINLLNNEARL